MRTNFINTNMDLVSQSLALCDCILSSSLQIHKTLPGITSQQHIGAQSNFTLALFVRVYLRYARFWQMCSPKFLGRAMGCLPTTRSLRANIPATVLQGGFHFRHLKGHNLLSQTHLAAQRGSIFFLWKMSRHRIRKSRLKQMRHQVRHETLE